MTLSPGYEMCPCEIVVQEFLTLDGVMQAPGRPDEDTRARFAFGGWTAPYFAEADSAAGEFMAKHLTPTDLLLGRWTYDMFAEYWPRNADNWPGILDVTKYVVSTTLNDTQVADSGWKNSKLLKSIDDVKVLKSSEDSALKVIGSSVLTQSLLAQDLVDELVLMTFPVVLGSGKRLFAEGASPTAFRMTEGFVAPNGVSFAHYEKAGSVETGIVGA